MSVCYDFSLLKRFHFVDIFIFPNVPVANVTISFYCKCCQNVSEHGATHEDITTKSLDLVMLFIFKHSFENYRPKNLKSTIVCHRDRGLITIASVWLDQNKMT